MITLYDCATAPSPRRARIFLAEKGVPYETVQVDLRNAEQLSGAYQKINPQCTVPALRTQEGDVLMGIPVDRDRSFRQIVTGDSGLS